MRTIEQAETECLESWKQNPSNYGWCIHHDSEVEKLTEPIEKRISYIINNKLTEQIITRLDNLRPVLSPVIITALKANCETISTILKAYSKAIHKAIKAYDETITMAWKVDHETIITTASKASIKARATALEDFKKARAMDREAYEKAKATAHAEEVPGHTWNGKSIFGS